MNHTHSVHPFFLLGGVESPTKFSKKGGLTESQFLERVSLERGGELFHGVAALT